jgi:hypothetical protein
MNLLVHPVPAIHGRQSPKLRQDITPPHNPTHNEVQKEEGSREHCQMHDRASVSYPRTIILLYTRSKIGAERELVASSPRVLPYTCDDGKPDGD